MLHDVHIAVWDNMRRDFRRAIVTVDADSGDDAASKAAVEAATLGDAWRIEYIGPAASPPPPADANVTEGADAPDEEAPVT